LKHRQPPACVEACPQEALTFGRRDDLIRIGRRRIEENQGRYVDYIYGEYEAGGTSWLYLSNVPFDQAGFNMAIPHEPILDSVKNFLAIVPMVLTIWPALFAGFHLLATRKEQQQKSHHEDSREE
jgi:ferredoxin